MVQILKSQFPSPKFIALPNVQGGALPLIPIFAGLNAVVALTGGISGVAKAMNDAQIARNQLQEATRHNKVIESLATGNGLYLKPYKSGSGLRIHNEQKKKFDKFSKLTLDQCGYNKICKNFENSSFQGCIHEKHFTNRRTQIEGSCSYKFR